MKPVTIRSFAEQIGVTPDKLLNQLAAAGIKHDSAEALLSREEKRKLLIHARGGAAPRSGGEPSTGKRKATSRIRQTSKGGGVRTIHVEVRKKRQVHRPKPPPPPLPETVAQQASEAAAAGAKTGAEAKAEAGTTTAAAAKAKPVNTKAETGARAEAETATAATAKAEAVNTSTGAEARAKTGTEAAGDTGDGEKPAATAARKEGENDDRKGARKTRGKRRSKLHVAADKKNWRRRPPRKVRKVQATIATQHGGFVEPTAPVVHKVQVPESITVGELAQAMSIKTADVIRKMMDMGSMATINEVLDRDTAMILIEEMGHVAEAASPSDPETLLLDEHGEADLELLPRAPVVTVMGHVDHGKTSLLDHIRETRVAAGEAGGITQHIGACRVATNKGEITFLDTPGHESFSAMRARGARVTDIVILVVAVNDGIKPQTIEAIHHARQATVPVVVAINKIDLEGGDPEKLKQELAAHELAPEQWGGDTLVVGVSAKTGEGVDKLLDAVLLQAELLDLKAPLNGPVAGVVIEARIDKGRGALATLLVQKGTLRVGDAILAGQENGRVRAITDENGRPMKQAGPATPVEVQGLSGAPAAGDNVIRVTDERKAREIAMLRQGRNRSARQSGGPAMPTENPFQSVTADKQQNLNLLIKADVRGSVEALREALEKLGNDEVRAKVVHSMVGGINESDVHLAMASDAIIIGFNVRPDTKTRGLVESGKVEVRYHSVIYHALEEVRDMLSGMLKPDIRENVSATVDVREVFRISRAGVIAGCFVDEGTVRRNSSARVLRDNIIIFNGKVDSLRRFKQNVDEVRSGMECGIGIKNYNDIRVNDQIEVYETIEVPRSA